MKTWHRLPLKFSCRSIFLPSLLPIEDIMDFGVEIPGFTDRYPELAGDDEKLDDVPEAPKIDDGTEPNKAPRVCPVLGGIAHLPFRCVAHRFGLVPAEA